MKSFRALLRAADAKPLETARLIGHVIGERPLYGSQAAIFLLGLIQGSCCASQVGYHATLKAIAKGHTKFLPLSPRDYIGMVPPNRRR